MVIPVRQGHARRGGHDSRFGSRCAIAWSTVAASYAASSGGLAAGLAATTTVASRASNSGMRIKSCGRFRLIRRVERSAPASVIGHACGLEHADYIPHTAYRWNGAGPHLQTQAGCPSLADLGDRADRRPAESRLSVPC